MSWCHEVMRGDELVSWGDELLSWGAELTRVKRVILGAERRLERADFAGSDVGVRVGWWRIFDIRFVRFFWSDSCQNLSELIKNLEESEDFLDELDELDEFLEELDELEEFFLSKMCQNGVNCPKIWELGKTISQIFWTTKNVNCSRTHVSIHQYYYSLFLVKLFSIN